MSLENMILSFMIYSLIMTVVVGILLIMKPMFFKNYSSQSRYMMWIITAVVMLIPFYLLPKIEITQAETTILELSAPSIEPVRFSIPSENHVVIDEPAEHMIIHDDIVTEAVIQTKPAETPAYITFNIEWYEIAGIVWLTGFLTVLLKTMIAYIKFCYTVSKSAVYIRKLRGITLIKSLSTGSPVSYGLFTKKIVLPNGVNRLILTHELTHIRRGDTYVKLLTVLLTAVYWFNPIVYFIARNISLECELSCDSEVLKNSDTETRYKYGKLILDSVGTESTHMKLAMSFKSGGRNIKKRIISIARFDKLKQKKVRHRYGSCTGGINIKRYGIGFIHRLR